MLIVKDKSVDYGEQCESQERTCRLRDYNERRAERSILHCFVKLSDTRERKKKNKMQVDLEQQLRE